MNTIIEKIRAEVEYSRDLNYKYYVKQGIGSPAEYRYDEDVRILSFLSALEKSEKPMNPQPVKIDIRKELASIEFMGVNDARDTETIARHFYELGRQSKEQPLGEDFDLESDRFFRKLPLRANTPPIPDEYIDEETFDRIARHFAQWGTEHGGSSETPADLEEAAVEYSAIGYSPFDDPHEKHQQFECSKFAFIAGAKWDREQMMKEVVEGEIQMRYSGCLCAKTIRAINEDKFKLGDKVRIIILPKED